MGYSIGLLVLLAFVGAECHFLNFDNEGEAALSFDLRSVATDPVTIDPQCLKLTKFFNTLGAQLKQYQPMQYHGLVHGAQMEFGVNVKDPAQLREFACKLISIKSLKGMLDLDISGHQVSYNTVKRNYQQVQSYLAASGGYTNAPRIAQFAKDLKRRAESLTPNATTPAEATTLQELTKLFEVMQVKYGSRWISFFSFNQEVLITDPQATAKKLFATKSFGDIKKVLGKEANAHLIRQFLLLGNRDIIPESFGPVDTYADGIVLLGELGFLNLEV